MLPVWMHEKDELYDMLRGPVENITVLATAYADPSHNGTGRHEPILLTVRYGKGLSLSHTDGTRRLFAGVCWFYRGAQARGPVNRDRYGNAEHSR